MDPASVIGVIGVVAQITQAIFVYGDAVSGCKAEVAQLRCELFGMHAALTQMEQDLELITKYSSTHIVASPNLYSPECQEMLNETRLVLEKLADTLKVGASRSENITKKLLWPLKRPHVQALATHLERLKTFFILAVTRDGLQATQDIQCSVNALSKSVQEIQKTQEEDSVYLEAMKWFAPCDPNITHATASSCRLVGTNAWFLDETFQDWASSTEPFLWLKGKPGSGKTCLMSACADRLLQADCVVSYFYCSYNESSSQEPRNILGSFIAQLCRQRSTVRHTVLAAYQESKTRNSSHELVQVPMMVSMIKKVTPAILKDVFLLVDAVNECGENLVAALEAVCQVVMGGGGRVRLVLSSTENVAQTVQDTISLYSLPSKEVNLDLSRVSSDINSYITARFSREPKLKRLRHELQVSLVKAIQSQHQGSFRWTSCTIDDLLRRATPRAIKSALDGVASTLGDIYMGILRNVPSDMADAAQAMLQYLVSAMRPLKLNELGEAVSLTFTDDFGEDDRLIEPEAIVHSLRSLVHYDAGNQRIELAHSSVRTFLTEPKLSETYHIDPVAANNAMTRACLYYLALSPFQYTCPDEAALAARKRDWPFLEYAACFWTRHARTLAQQQCEDEAYLALFSKFAASTGNFAAWYQCIYPKGGSLIWETKPLYMCAREGLVGPLRSLLIVCSRDEIEERGGARSSTALHVAATYGEVEAVKVLLAAGADPNERNAFGENGIQWAAFWHHDETVRVLLEAGASPDLLSYQANPELYTGMVQHAKTTLSRYTGKKERATSARVSVLR
ncbi:hypothetical protein LMH87_002060 [Akanthomyces muscarius]|uniref:Ankyrin repeat protein n=1 Tax=Akanthomyces muscarius TaxID=2231603 RepID=A0A9W8UJA2_AKAMU|nr:hypothetical protein LMH87_002060 [Akanthomyces muscarius]KAJ4147548.1 hypothetical protein LMH87_002060 [Akanthomyces muscarius]